MPTSTSGSHTAWALCDCHPVARCHALCFPCSPVLDLSLHSCVTPLNATSFTVTSLTKQWVIEGIFLLPKHLGHVILSRAITLSILQMSTSPSAFGRPLGSVRRGGQLPRVPLSSHTPFCSPVLPKLGPEHIVAEFDFWAVPQATFQLMQSCSCFIETRHLCRLWKWAAEWKRVGGLGQSTEMLVCSRFAEIL